MIREFTHARRAFALLPVLGMLLPACAQTPTHSCADLMKVEMPGVALRVLKAEPIAAAAPGTVRISPNFPGFIQSALPSHCRVDGVIDERTGAGGKPYGIGFALALPDEWSGRFLFQGGGGLNGSVAAPLGMVAAGEAPALARGFAVVTTDSGHKGSVFDGGFFEDQQASLDFYYVAIGRVTQAAKHILAWYYGRPQGHSYYAGCSTGGREAMIMSQRYPSYFDGIVSGAPAMRTGHSNLALAYIASVFTQAAPKDAAGKASAQRLFSDSDKKLIVQALLDACDEKDGTKDGMIFDIRGCKFDPAALACKAEKTEACLSAQQVSALRQAFEGPKDARGRQIYPGFPFDAGIAESVGLPGLLYGPRIPVAAPDPNTPFDADAAAARLAADTNSRLGDSTWTNLSTFSGRGGKLLFYHGMSDPWFSAFDTLDYYERMTRQNGGRERVESWSRLYLLPGMGHCGGGSAALDQFDLLTAVVDWVEKGKAPEPVATGRAFPGRSRPLCAFPKHAQYAGQGDPQDARSFACRD